MKANRLAVFTAILAALAFTATAAPTLQHALVPNATVIVTCNGDGAKGTLLDKVNKQFGDMVQKAAVEAAGDDAKPLQKFLDAMPKEARDGGKLLASVDLSQLDFDNPDPTKIPFCIGLEFKVSVRAFADLVVAELNKDKDIAKECHIAKGKVAGLDAYEITLTELPISFALAFTPDGKTFFFSTKDFLAKQLALPAPVTAFPPAAVEAQKGVIPGSCFALFTGLSANILALKDKFCADGAKAEDKETADMAKNLIPLKGAALSLFSDAATIKIAIDASFADANAPKFWKQIIDAQVITAAKQVGPAALGKEKIPCLETLACTANGNHCTLALTITQADVDIIAEAAKAALGDGEGKSAK